MKKLSILLAVLMAVGLFCGVLAGCNREDEEGIDETKTQLYVANFDGGVGDEWLNNVKIGFEEKYKDRSFEDGKVGVQIKIYNNIDNLVGPQLVNSIATSSQEVFFTEAVNYYEFVNKDLLYDITDIVTEPLTEFGEDKTIESKMIDEQKNYYKISNVTDQSKVGKYYALPFYEAYQSIQYDVELFEEKDYYYGADGKLMCDPASTTEVKSAGPDNQTGTYDDGMPATFDEFFALCDQMVSDGITPFAWSGKNQDYFSALYAALAVNTMGVDNAMLNYTMDGGTATDLVQFDASGNMVFEADGVTPKQAEDLPITESNAYELARQEGIYYALKFTQKVATTEGYTGSNCWSPSQSHISAQDDYLLGKHEPQKVGRSAFLVDGTWWENEATGAFNTQSQSYEGAGKMDRKISLMPLPRATAGHVGGKQTLMCVNESACFINGNISEEKAVLAKLFLQYVHTDEAMINFTKDSGTLRAFNYTIPQEVKDDLSYYVNSIITAKEQSNVVYPNANSKLYQVDAFNFRMLNLMNSTIDGEPYTLAVKTFHDHPEITAEEYFEGVYTSRKARWAEYDL